MQNQYQKRWIVTDFHRSVLDNCHYSDMEDGYWETSPGCINRIRFQCDYIGDGASKSCTTLTTKSGSGVTRTFEETAFDATSGRVLIATCPYRLNKRRFHFPGDWKLDVFQGPLTGLVTLEVGLGSPDEEFRLPAWVIEAREVTEHLSNYHLARLGGDLRGLENDRPIHEMLARVPRIVVTGGPCSGKSSVMKVLSESPAYRDILHCVPEVATIVIGQVGVRPPVSDEVAFRRFQRLIYMAQTGFEEVSETQALTDKKLAVVTDRGVIDNAAYLKDGLHEMALVCRTNVQYELGRYDMVIHLGVPEKAVYDANKENNPARNESWVEAMELDMKIGEVWGHHPRYYPIHSCSSMDEKIERATRQIDKFLGWFQHQP